MPYINVDIDLDEFDLDDLIHEVLNRLRKATPKQKKELKDEAIEILEAVDEKSDTLIEVKSLDDKIKYEHLKKVFNKYSTPQLEALIP